MIKMYKFVLKFAVVALIFFGTASNGNARVTIYSISEAPKKVMHVQVIKRQRKNIVLRWKAQTGVQRYQIRVMNKKKKLIKKVNVKKSKKFKRKYVKAKVIGLKAGRLYKFRVRAQRSGQFGKYSKRINGRTKLPESTDDEDVDTEEPDQNEEEDDGIEDGDDTDDPVDEDKTDDGSSDEDPVEEDEEEVVSSGIPYGFWGLNGYVDDTGLPDVQNRFSASVFQISSSGAGYTVGTLLPLVRDAGMQVTLRMTPRPDYTKDFDLQAWKDHIDTWVDSGVQEFIDDGTLAGHMLIDDIYNFSYISGSENPTATEIDDMAEYSKNLFPGLMTYVRHRALDMPSGTYEHLDAVVNQYKESRGDVDVYAATEAAAANALGVGMINGLNIVDGGDGSSGQTGTTSSKYAMTAEEITEYGEALLAVDNVLMFLMWEYDGKQKWYDGTIGSTYFDKAEIQAALKALGEVAATY